jgi:hypothetical protein
MKVPTAPSFHFNVVWIVPVRACAARKRGPRSGGQLARGQDNGFQTRRPEHRRSDAGVGDRGIVFDAPDGEPDRSRRRLIFRTLSPDLTGIVTSPVVGPFPAPLWTAQAGPGVTCARRDRRHPREALIQVKVSRGALCLSAVQPAIPAGRLRGDRHAFHFATTDAGIPSTPTGRTISRQPSRGDYRADGCRAEAMYSQTGVIRVARIPGRRDRSRP